MSCAGIKNRQFENGFYKNVGILYCLDRQTDRQTDRQILFY